jgi:hypothetical protein
LATDRVRVFAPTEQRNPASAEIDTLATAGVLRVINAADAEVAGVVGGALDRLAEAADLAIAALRADGRVHYFGAGSSGRYGVLDAAEIPPTPDHPNTLTTRKHLAAWRGEAGDPLGAVREFESLLDDCRRILGPDNPETMSIRGNLARWRGESGDPGDAARDLEHLHADRARILGPDHPDTLATKKRLAFWRARANGKMP